MTRLTFAEVRAALQQDDTAQAFRCIAAPYHPLCGNDLDEERKDLARRMLAKPTLQLTLRELRDIINLLMCAYHQQGTYSHKDNVEFVWCHEFPHLDFRTRRHRSPYSLVNKRHFAFGRPTRIPITPPSSGRMPVEVRTVRLATPPPRPIFIPDMRGSNSAGPPTPPTPTVSEDDNETFGVPESPLNARGSTARLNGQVEVFATAEEEHITPPLNHEESPADHDNRMQDLPAAGSIDHQDEEVPGQQGQATDDRFTPGDASTWAPWTIRSEVLTLLLEPLPKPQAKGAIYAVNVRSGPTPVVKVGYTTRAVSTRLREITNQHRLTLNRNTVFHISGIPLLQLMRLESLVHADLAFFQRDLRTQHGRTQRTHREYFEVDLATAQRTITRWWGIMRDIGLEPGQELDREVINVIHSSSALNIESSDAEPTTLNPEVWSRMNADHRRREDVWDIVFRRNGGGFKRDGGRSGSAWMFAAVLLFVAPDVFKCPPKVAYAVAALLLSLLKHWRVL